MRLTLLASLVLVGVALSGCGRDPGMHGPYLIGATGPERAPVPAGCCRPGDVRSQDLNSGWIDNCYEIDQDCPTLSPGPDTWAEVPAVAPARPPVSRSAWN